MHPKSMLKDSRFYSLVALVIITLLTGVLFYHRVEGWGWIDALYFSVITLTTVGYGDIHPVTDIGKMFTITYIFVGVGILLSFIRYMSHHAIKSAFDSRIYKFRNIYENHKQNSLKYKNN